jgi:hypothetical protein
MLTLPHPNPLILRLRSGGGEGNPGNGPRLAGIISRRRDCHASLAMTCGDRGWRESFPVRERLPHTFQVLAMTKSEVPDESGNCCTTLKGRTTKHEGGKSNKCSCGSLDPQRILILGFA